MSLNPCMIWTQKGFFKGFVKSASKKVATSPSDKIYTIWREFLSSNLKKIDGHFFPVFDTIN